MKMSIILEMMAKEKMVMKVEGNPFMSLTAKASKLYEVMILLF